MELCRASQKNPLHQKWPLIDGRRSMRILLGHTFVLLSSWCRLYWLLWQRWCGWRPLCCLIAAEGGAYLPACFPAAPVQVFSPFLPQFRFAFNFANSHSHASLNFLFDFAFAWQNFKANRQSRHCWLAIHTFDISVTWIIISIPKALHQKKF